MPNKRYRPERLAQEIQREVDDKATGLIRKELGARLNIFKTPAIKFERDPSIAYGNRIDELLRKLHREDQL